jgi:hypothetical protein
MPAPTIYATGMFDKVDELLLEMKEHDKEIKCGVASVGEAAAYAEVWEWGNSRQTKQGPKTVQGTNPDGETVWLSNQAPSGYIKINENHFWDVLKDELSKVKFKSTTAKGITEELQEAGRKAMKRCIPFIQDSAPVDSGKLSKSFRVVEDGDEMLEDSDDSRTLILDQGE